jgi:hypothetical protein
MRPLERHLFLEPLQAGEQLQGQRGIVACAWRAARRHV